MLAVDERSGYQEEQTWHDAGRSKSVKQETDEACQAGGDGCWHQVRASFYSRNESDQTNEPEKDAQA